MNRAVVLVVLAACGSKSDAPPPPPPAAPAPPVASASGKVRLLDDAMRLAVDDPTFFAIAHAMLANKNPVGARAALARLHEDHFFDDDLQRLDVLQLLGEDQAAAMKNAETRSVPDGGRVIEAYERVESPPAIEVATDAVAKTEDFPDVIGRLALFGALVPGTPRWTALVKAVATDASRTMALGQLAHWLHADEVARALVGAAAKLEPSDEIIDELLVVGDRPLAIATLARAPAPAGEGMALAKKLEGRAIVQAELGNAADAAALAARADAIAKPLVLELPIAERDGWSGLVALYAQARGELQSSHYGATSAMSPDGIRDLCTDLVDHDLPDIAVAVAEKAHSVNALEQIVRLELLRGDLARARDLAVSRHLDLMTKPLLTAFALRGDIASVGELSHASEDMRVVGVRELAQAFAKAGNCAKATELAVNAPDGYTYAIVARHCP